MPHLRFRAISESSVQHLSKQLLDDLEPLMNSPREDFTFELIPSIFFHEGKEGNAYPFIEILWFDRGQKVQDKVAKLVTERVRNITETSGDIAVIFRALNPNAYYDNGEHY